MGLTCVHCVWGGSLSRSCLWLGGDLPFDLRHSPQGKSVHLAAICRTPLAGHFLFVWMERDQKRRSDFQFRDMFEKGLHNIRKKHQWANFFLSIVYGDIYGQVGQREIESQRTKWGQNQGGNNSKNAQDCKLPLGSWLRRCDGAGKTCKRDSYINTDDTDLRFSVYLTNLKSELGNCVLFICIKQQKNIITCFV